MSVTRLPRKRERRWSLSRADVPATPEIPEESLFVDTVDVAVTYTDES